MKWSNLLIILLIVAAGAAFFFAKKGLDTSPTGGYDSFAQCLTDSGATFYGAYWCGHCQNQKKVFGASWDLVNSVECSLPNRGGQTEACKDAGIQSYPTWEFGDGIRKMGSLSFEKLSEFSGCSLN